MDNVLMIVLVVALVIYPRKDIFVDRFVFTLKAIGLHIELSAKEKNDPPYKSDRSNRKK